MDLNTQIKSIEDKLELAQRFNTTDSLRSLKGFDLDYRAKHWNKDVEDTTFYSGLICLFLTGFYLSIYGAVKWQTKIQSPQDRLLAMQVILLEKQVNGTKNTDRPHYESRLYSKKAK